MTDVVLEVRGLRKTFDPGLFVPAVEVLKGVDLEVRRSEIFGLLGPNGAGKTTTLKAILDVVRPDTGEIRICGLRHDSPEAWRRVGFMPESPPLYPHLTGVEYLEFCARLLDLPAAEASARVRDVLERVTMSSRADRPMRTFSKGMQQRISLAQALLGGPDLLLLDEPMSGLDPLGRRDVRDLIVSERERGTTVFFSSLGATVVSGASGERVPWNRGTWTEGRKERWVLLQHTRLGPAGGEGVAGYTLTVDAR